MQAVKHKDFLRIVQALEIIYNVEHNIPKSDKYALLKLLSDDMKCSAHAFLLFHLRELGLDEWPTTLILENIDSPFHQSIK